MHCYKGRLQGLSTRCVHAGEPEEGTPQTPIYATTLFTFQDTQQLSDTVAGRRSGGLYTRFGQNPTIQALETKLAALEEGEMALAFSSGMAAESALFMSHGRQGIVTLGDVYGGTLTLVADQLSTLGIPFFPLLGNELNRLEETLAQGPGLIFLETPTNPALEVFDIAAIAEIAHRHGALLAVDNTFASPVNQQPLALGADLVMHSATKYLGGHSDLTAGTLIGSRELLEPVNAWRKSLGSVPAPETASLLARSLRTLVVRIRQHNAGAQQVAEALARHPGVERVLYPGLDSFPGHELAKRQMQGFGGMLTITVGDSGEHATRFVDRLRLFALAPSLGGVESLVTQPLTLTHHAMGAAERARRGISDNMVRLSVGLEDPADLIEDLYQALEG